MKEKSSEPYQPRVEKEEAHGMPTNIQSELLRIKQNKKTENRKFPKWKRHGTR